jgi:hypothetical protein
MIAKSQRNLPQQTRLPKRKGPHEKPLSAMPDALTDLHFSVDLILPTAQVSRHF